MFRAKELTIMIKAWCFLWVIHIQLKVLGFQNTLQSIIRYSEKFEVHSDNVVEMMHISRLVYHASSYFPARADCLPRSIVLYRILICQGYDTDLYIGVTRPFFQAHAWVQHRERVISDSLKFVSQFQPIWSTCMVTHK